MQPPKLSFAVIAAAIAATVGACSSETQSQIATPPPAQRPSVEPSPSDRKPEHAPRIHWRRSVAVGSPTAGSLIRSVQLPARGTGFVTWDPNLHRSPNRGWRRWGTDRLVRRLLTVAREYRAAHSGARPLLIGDLSRPHGGNFGRQFGYVWHASHQNGLDADVYYPRADRSPRAPGAAADIDRRLAQDLVDRFVRAGATNVFVGPGTGLTGPSGVVQVIAQHDDHMHVRMPPVQWRGAQ